MAHSPHEIIETMQKEMILRIPEQLREEIESFAMAQIAYQSNSFKLTLEEIKNNIFENFIGCELV